MKSCDNCRFKKEYLEMVAPNCSATAMICKKDKVITHTTLERGCELWEKNIRLFGILL